MSADPLLRVDDLSVHFGGNQGILDHFLGDDKGVVRAVDDVSLGVGENDVITLVGKSDCGRTTLRKAITDLQRPTSRTVRFRGQDIWESDPEPGNTLHKEIRKSLQMVHQNAGNSLDPDQVIFKSLNPALKKWQPELNPVERRELIHQMLDTARLTPVDDYAFRYPY